MNEKDQKEYQEYLEYLEYLDYLDSLENKPQTPPKEEKVGVGETILRGLNVVGGTTRGLAAQALEPIVGKQLVSMKELGSATVPQTSELLARAGVPEGYSLSDIVPSMFTPSGKEWTKFQKGGFLDPSIRGAAGLVGDVALDPSTYFLPALKGAGVLGPKIAPLVSKMGPTATRVAEIALNPLGEAFTGTVKGLGTVGKSVAGKFSQFSPEEATQYLQNPAAVKEATELLSDKRTLDVAQQKAFDAINKMRSTIKKAGISADKEMSEILEGKNIQANLNSLKELSEGMPAKKKAEYLGIIKKAEKDLEAYRPFEPEFGTTTAKQQGVEGLTFPEVKTEAQIRPSSVVEEVQIQPDLFPQEVVTKAEAGILPKQTVPMGAGYAEQIPASIKPSEIIGESSLQGAFFPDVKSAKLSAGITPAKLVRPASSEYFSPESLKFSQMMQEPLPFPTRGVRPEAATIGAPEARRLKQILQEEATFGRSSPITAVGTPRYTEYADEANKLMQSLREIDKVKELDDYMRQGIVLQQALEKAESAPLQFLKTQSEDVTAGLARAARRTGDKEVFDLANQLSAARKIIGKGDYDDWVSRSGIRLAGRTALKAIDKFQKTGAATQDMINKVIKDPNVPPQIWMEMLRSKQEGKEQ